MVVYIPQKKAYKNRRNLHVDLLSRILFVFAILDNYIGCGMVFIRVPCRFCLLQCEVAF